MADFAELKAKVTLEQAGQMLGLQLRKSGAQFRGPCPACQSGGERALALTPAKGLFYCFNANAGGDVINLVGHVLKCPLADAGTKLAEHFGIGRTTPTAPQKPERGTNPAKNFDADEFASSFGYDETVEALGLSEATANAYRIGVRRGKLYIPICPPDVQPIAFLEVQDGKLKLPDKWLGTNVVPLKRPA